METVGGEHMNRAQRTASHSKRQYQDVMPKFWIPKLEPIQCLDAKIIHWDLINRFTDGSAADGDLWDWIETGYTYKMMMILHVKDGREFTPEALAAIDEQIDIYASVIARHRKTGRVGFNGTELCIAKAAANVMDDLLGLDRHGIAVKAGQWAVAQLGRIRSMTDTAAMGSNTLIHCAPTHSSAISNP